ncbi:MAG TPA: Imm1 family immunity protein [Actinokineospora sp.]|nr:Imm1 family immunity protein [Actinokineospora sp.]
MGIVLEVAYHNDVPVKALRTAADIEEFMAELLAADPGHRSASVYAIDEATDADPDHEMIVGVNPERGVGVVRYSGGDPIPGDDAEEWFSARGQAVTGTVVYTYFGTGHDFPADAEVSVDLVKEAMGELLARDGKRPTCVTWSSTWRR